MVVTGGGRRSLEWGQTAVDQLFDDTVQLISCDVFDTLLLRTSKSQRSRLAEAEYLFSTHLTRCGFNIAPAELLRARVEAENHAYRALNVGGGLGEVCLRDLICRQLSMLGIPESLVDIRIAFEIEVEKRSLFANQALARLLRRRRSAGVRIVAVSDTALTSASVAELLTYFHGPDLVDKIYSSADLSASKRSGQLFSMVAAQEDVSPSRMIHIGDDDWADRAVPRSIGIKTIRVARPKLRQSLRRVDGAWTLVASRLPRGTLQHTEPDLSTQTAFGREIFGPIVGQFCLAIWLYAKQAEASEDAVLLFCARGGLGIRQAFERLIERFQLKLVLPRENLMISRLVAARTAVGCRSEVLLDELQREFKTQSFAEVAAALGGRHYDLPDRWHRPFSKMAFYSMLDGPEAMPLRTDIDHQRRLFENHLDSVAGRARRIILCDTGLYGSTQRLLMAGMPERNFETVQFARCNYKGLGEQHFHRVAGLVVEDNLYNPLKIQTVVLRYWQIIEALFEPAIPSVRQLFESGDGSVSCNAGSIAHAGFDPTKIGPMLSGVLAYLDAAEDGLQVSRDADQAWRRLKRAITKPTETDMRVLGVGERSIDFGRSESVAMLTGRSSIVSYQKLKALKSQLWREAAIARDFPAIKSPLLFAMEAAHIGRKLSACLRTHPGVNQ